MGNVSAESKDSIRAGQKRGERMVKVKSRQSEWTGRCRGGLKGFFCRWRMAHQRNITTPEDVTVKNEHAENTASSSERLTNCPSQPIPLERAAAATTAATSVISAFSFSLAILSRNRPRGCSYRGREGVAGRRCGCSVRLAVSLHPPSTPQRFSRPPSSALPASHFRRAQTQESKPRHFFGFLGR